MSEAKHTPTPWAISLVDECVITPVVDPRFGICTTSDDNERTERDAANAAFIVRACNSFDALLAACNAALGAFERNDCIDWSYLERAIAAAEGEERG